MRLLLILTGINGFFAVLLGAFGAHGLQAYLAADAELSKRMGWWETASLYHLVHTLALGFTALLAEKSPRWAKYIGLCFQLGILLFAGSLYTMTITGTRGLGMLTPLGGSLLLAGWAAVAVAGFRSRR